MSNATWTGRMSDSYEASYRDLVANAAPVATRQTPCPFWPQVAPDFRCGCSGPRQDRTVGAGACRRLDLPGRP